MELAVVSQKTPEDLFEDIPKGLSTSEMLDAIEVRLLENGASYREPGEELEDFPLVHAFPDKMYVRQLFMPAGSIVVTVTHATEHPFTVSQGLVSCWTEFDGWVQIKAPFSGITYPGTRRLILVHLDTIWTSYHVNIDDIKDVAEMERILHRPRTNPLVTKLLVENTNVEVEQ